MPPCRLFLATETIAILLMSVSFGAAQTPAPGAKSAGDDISFAEAALVVQEYLDAKGKSRLQVDEVKECPEGWKVTVATGRRVPVAKIRVDSKTGEIIDKWN